MAAMSRRGYLMDGASLHAPCPAPPAFPPVSFPPGRIAAMLNLLAGKERLCDGVTRRSFLKIGALAVGGLSLPQLLKAESASGARSAKSIIMVYLSGGLSH